MKESVLSLKVKNTTHHKFTYFQIACMYYYITDPLWRFYSYDYNAIGSTSVVYILHRVINS